MGLGSDSMEEAVSSARVAWSSAVGNLGKSSVLSSAGATLLTTPKGAASNNGMGLGSDSMEEADACDEACSPAGKGSVDINTASPLRSSAARKTTHYTDSTFLSQLRSSASQPLAKQLEEKRLESK
eukprot:TRINITY_DN5846_c0_g1_i3.p2 TRINITY_DN5846_c0_g1~~TRINITY_DN5846_c0_g1_i3.p2  ORF type:complete len:126 (+),score=30.22 TRINITY_DN5846_c0_g1_i3:456-833(+)